MPPTVTTVSTGKEEKPGIKVFDQSMSRYIADLARRMYAIHHMELRAGRRAANGVTSLARVAADQRE